MGNMSPVKDKTQYESAVARIAELSDAAPGTPEADERDVLQALVEKYERDELSGQSAIEAIRLRMEQRGLKPADLTPYIGSRSKVSEVLSGRRALSLSMIRKLHKGLDIPAEVLIADEGVALPEQMGEIDWTRFPLAEMAGRGWLACQGSWRELLENAEEALGPFLFPRGMDCRLAAFMQDRHYRGLLQPDEYALWAWIARVLSLAMRDEVASESPAHLTEEMVREVIHLSRLDAGPQLAREILHEGGIHLVFEPHLSGAPVDGASMRCPEGHCVIAMTLRQDRTDAFWQTLAHELAHVTAHLQTGRFSSVVDDLGANPEDDIEQETDAIAEALLIPPDVWAEENASLNTAYDVKRLAAQLRIHPAIIAGRLQRDRGNRQLHAELVGQGKVRRIVMGEGNKI